MLAFGFQGCQGFGFGVDFAHFGVKIGIAVGGGGGGGYSSFFQLSEEFVVRSAFYTYWGISLKTKIGVYRTVVLTTLLYRSESWTLYRCIYVYMYIYNRIYIFISCSVK